MPTVQDFICNKFHHWHPWVHTEFAEGCLPTIRRNDRYWAGLWDGLIIEQVKNNP